MSEYDDGYAQGEEDHRNKVDLSSAQQTAIWTEASHNWKRGWAHGYEAAAEITRATPSADFEASGTVHPCLACGHDMKKVPGGQGPTWVHVDTGVTVCTSAKEA